MYMYKVYVQCKYISIYKAYFHRPIIVLCIHSHVFFFYLGFLSCTFTIYRTAGEEEGYLFNTCQQLPPASQALRP